MKTVLITGVGGYIGRHVVKAVAARGARIIGLDRVDPCSPVYSKFIEADLLSPDFRISDYIDEVPDACLHLAWRNGFNHNATTHLEDLSGHFRFVEGLFELGIPQVALMGTMHEVGYWEGAIDEDTPCNPQSLYGVAKDALRKAVLIRGAETGIAVQWLRGFYVFGDDAAAQSIFGKITRAVAEGKKTFPFTSGKNEYDFLIIDDLAEQIASCVLQDKVSGIINCCSGHPESLASRVERYIREHGWDIELQYGAYPDRAYDSPGVWGDATKIRAIMQACDE